MGMENYFSPLANQVRDNWFWLEKGNQESQQWLAKKVHGLYQNLKSTAFFKHKLQTATHAISKNRGYHWNPVYEDKNCRAGLLTIIPNSEIPLHDHSDSIGVSMVLSGNPTISQGQTLAKTKKLLRLFHLLQIKHKKLFPWDINYTFPNQKNIHGFVTKHSPAMLFNLVFFRETQQHHCFIPIGIENSSRGKKKQMINKPLSWIFMVNFILATSAYASCNPDTLKQSMPIEISKEKLALLEQCSMLENGAAQFHLAELYYSGTAIKQDLYQAYYWYLKAAKNGHTKAQYQVGVMLLDGKGVTEDSFEGLEWIFTSSQGGNTEATEVLNYILENPAALEC